MERVFAIDCVTGERVNIYDDVVSSVIVNKVNDVLIYGYTKEETKPCALLTYGDVIDCIVPVKSNFQFIYDNRFGKELLDIGMSEKDKVYATYSRGRYFPYKFRKDYEAVTSFNLFKNKQVVLNNVDFPIAGVFRYTFGLEFETSNGIIPEEICFRDGLIPLRDGSISGNEYSTVVLSGNSGFNLLFQQLQTLRKYTRFDKECSLHVHLGGFPLDAEKILNLYNICYSLQSEIQSYIPRYTFFTYKYKNSGKDYCKPLETSYSSFEDFYYNFTNNRFFGNFEQPHQSDIDRNRKWNITQRYYWVNLLNLICYRVNKTVEFRFLRPSFNLEKILTWMYMFNAILIYAETVKFDGKHIDLFKILSTVYPKELYDMLVIQLYKLEVCVSEQNSVGDLIGMRTDIDDEIFECSKII